jgi:hypothetical protein
MAEGHNVPRNVTVPSIAVVEAYAHLNSVVDVWNSLADGTVSAFAEPYGDIAIALFEDAFGTGGTVSLFEDVANPVVVEASARSSEVTAAFLEALASRAPQFRDHAKRIRDAGSTAVPFKAEPPEALWQQAYDAMGDALDTLRRARSLAEEAKREEEAHDDEAGTRQGIAGGAA